MFLNINMHYDMNTIGKNPIFKYLKFVQVDKLVTEIEFNTDLNHYYVHLDMDAFFASVEMRDDPSLK